MSQHLTAAGSQALALLPALTITTAIGATATTPVGIQGARYLSVQANFTYGSGGTTAKVYVQVSLDGTNWCDVMCFAFTTSTARRVQAVVSTTALSANVTPTDGTLADNTIVSGLLGAFLRVKVVTTGTYAGGTALQLDAVVA